MGRFLCFGSLNIDHVYQVEHFVAPGETAPSLSYQRNLGGKGFNQSVALARAGAIVVHAGKVGPDGEEFFAALEAAGVDTGLIERGGSVTGHAVIQVNRAGQNCILLHGGANREIGPELIERALKSLGPGDVLVLQNEISGLPELLAGARERGIPVALNPSPMDGTLAGLDLGGVRWLLLNEVEGAALTGLRQPQEMAGELLRRWPKLRVVLTLGSRGVLYRDAREQCALGACPVRPVDTTAAGDTFTGYFLSETLRGAAVGEALRMASVAAALAVTRPGAARSIPERAEVLHSAEAPEDALVPAEFV